MTSATCATSTNTEARKAIRHFRRTWVPVIQSILASTADVIADWVFYFNTTKKVSEARDQIGIEGNGNGNGNDRVIFSVSSDILVPMLYFFCIVSTVMCVITVAALLYIQWIVWKEDHPHKEKDQEYHSYEHEDGDEDDSSYREYKQKQFRRRQHQKHVQKVQNEKLLRKIMLSEIIIETIPQLVLTTLVSRMTVFPRVSTDAITSTHIGNGGDSSGTTSLMSVMSTVILSTTSSTNDDDDGSNGSNSSGSTTISLTGLTPFAVFNLTTSVFNLTFNTLDMMLPLSSSASSSTSTATSTVTSTSSMEDQVDNSMNIEQYPMKSDNFDDNDDEEKDKHQKENEKDNNNHDKEKHKHEEKTNTTQFYYMDDYLDSSSNHETKKEDMFIINGSYIDEMYRDFLFCSRDVL